MNKAPPGLLPPASPAPFNPRGGADASFQGTQISHNGIVSVNLIVDDLEIPFMAVRDSVRFLNSLFPNWSLPAFMGGISLPGEVGATYSIEMFEKKEIGEYDMDSKEVRVKKKKTITIKDIINQSRLKVISFEVHSKLDSDIFNEPFPEMTYIVVEIKSFPYEAGKYHLSITFDGGPHDVEATYCCLCFSNPASLKLQEDAQEMRPKVYQQASSVLNYIKNFNPNDAVSRQMSNHILVNSPQPSALTRAQQQSRLGSKGGSSFHQAEDDMNSQGGGGGSKISKGSQGKAFEYTSPPGMLNLRADSAYAGNSGWSTGTPPASGTSSADEIRKLYELYNMGALTKQEFEIEKRKLIEGNNPGMF